MDREGWWATVHGVARVRHDLETKPPPPHQCIERFEKKEKKDKEEDCDVDMGWRVDYDLKINPSSLLFSL